MSTPADESGMDDRSKTSMSGRVLAWLGLRREASAAPVTAGATVAAWDDRHPAGDDAPRAASEPTTVEPAQSGRDSDAHWRHAALSESLQDLLFGDTASPDTQPLSPVEHAIEERLGTRLQGPISPRLLPKLPDTVAQLMTEIRRGVHRHRRIEELVRRDPALAGDVLKMANSAWFHRGDTAVSSIEHAIMVIGHDGVISALLMGPFSKVPTHHFRQFGHHLWDHSVACALACRSLAQREALDESVAYFLGLIHNVGKMAIFRLVTEALSHGAPGTAPSSALFRRLIHAHGHRVAAAVVEPWGVSAELPSALLEQERAALPGHLDTLSPLGRTLFLGNLSSAVALLVKEGRIPLQDATRLLDAYGLVPEDLGMLGQLQTA